MLGLEIGPPLRAALEATGITESHSAHLLLAETTTHPLSAQFLLPRYMVHHGISHPHDVSCPSAAVSATNQHIISGSFSSDTHGYVFVCLAGLIFELAIKRSLVKCQCVILVISDFLEEAGSAGGIMWFTPWLLQLQCPYTDQCLLETRWGQQRG